VLSGPDPFGALLAVTAAGFGGLGLAWWGAAGSGRVDQQIAYLASGGAGGLAMVGAGVGLLLVHLRRRSEAIEMALLADMTAATRELLEFARAGARSEAKGASEEDMSRAPGRQEGGS
jgi:hypothetical protein